MNYRDHYGEILRELSHDDIREVYNLNLDVNEPDLYGNYLLNIACELLQIENVEFFISTGANLESKGRNDDTPILVAIDHVHRNPVSAIKIVEMLLNNGANIESRGYMDKTPFLKACTRVNLDMIRLLVSRGCNVRAITNDPPGCINDGLFFADVMHASAEVKEYLQKVIR